VTDGQRSGETGAPAGAAPADVTLADATLGDSAQADSAQADSAQADAPRADTTRTDSARADAAGAGALPRRKRPGFALAVACAALVVALVAGVSVGPAGLSLATIGDALVAKLPWHPAVSVPPIDLAIVWQIRLPRVILAALVGAMLSGGGAAYQGVFRNPLADPYLLGIAGGAGLAATIAVVAGAGSALVPPLAFVGGVGAVALTYVLGSGAGRDRESPGLTGSTTSIVLAGVAVAALLTAIQTYLLQQHTQVLQQVYSWILGELSLASWTDVTTILPYVAVSAVVLLAHRRLLDVLRLGEAEASTLGVNVARLRLTVVLAATLGTAAAVSVSGLIGFVGIIVPHTVRLTAGSSYRVVLPVSMVAGAAFLVLADIVARTAQAPAEVPIGVITAAAGAPFFLFILRSRRALRDLA
jgi:iron complex transport system permease protein